MAAYIVGGTDAGAGLTPYYRMAEQMYPILPDEVIIRADTLVGTFGLAWYYGIDPDTGFPMFAVRDDIVVSQTPYIGLHEAGHAFQTMVARGIAQRRGISVQEAIDEGRVGYWQMMGYPGTWWDAHLHAINGAGWSYYPDESFADSFAHTVFGYFSGQWTQNYGVPFDVARATAFFKALEFEATGGTDLDEATTRNIARQEATDAVARYAFEALETGFNPIKKAYDPLLRHKHGIDGTITTEPVIT